MSVVSQQVKTLVSGFDHKLQESAGKRWGKLLADSFSKVERYRICAGARIGPIAGEHQGMNKKPRVRRELVRVRRARSVVGRTRRFDDIRAIFSAQTSDSASQRLIMCPVSPWTRRVHRYCPGRTIDRRDPGVVEFAGSRTAPPRDADEIWRASRSHAPGFLPSRALLAQFQGRGRGGRERGDDSAHDSLHVDGLVVVQPLQLEPIEEGDHG